MYSLQRDKNRPHVKECLFCHTTLEICFRRESDVSYDPQGHRGFGGGSYLVLEYYYCPQCKLMYQPCFCEECNNNRKKMDDD